MHATTDHPRRRTPTSTTASSRGQCRARSTTDRPSEAAPIRHPPRRCPKARIMPRLGTNPKATWMDHGGDANARPSCAFAHPPLACPPGIRVNRRWAIRTPFDAPSRRAAPTFPCTSSDVHPGSASHTRVHAHRPRSGSPSVGKRRHPADRSSIASQHRPAEIDGVVRPASSTGMIRGSMRRSPTSLHHGPSKASACAPNARSLRPSGMTTPDRIHARLPASTGVASRAMLIRAYARVICAFAQVDARMRREVPHMRSPAPLEPPFAVHAWASIGSTACDRPGPMTHGFYDHPTTPLSASGRDAVASPPDRRRPSGPSPRSAMVMRPCADAPHGTRQPAWATRRCLTTTRVDLAAEPSSARRPGRPLTRPTRSSGGGDHEADRTCERDAATCANAWVACAFAQPISHSRIEGVQMRSEASRSMSRSRTVRTPLHGPDGRPPHARSPVRRGGRPGRLRTFIAEDRRTNPRHPRPSRGGLPCGPLRPGRAASILATPSPGIQDARRSVARPVRRPVA
jgi:hypothetical protein